MHTIRFVKAFFKNWKEVGSPFPSSRYVAKKICEAIDFRSARTIVEIGAGVGNITKELLKCLRPDAQLIVFEINEELCESLRAIQDKRLVIYNASGFELDSLVQGEADYVISEIPVANLPPALQNNFYEGIKSALRERGTCIQLQLSLLSYRRLRQVFKTVKVGFTLLNPPPAFIYSCRD